MVINASRGTSSIWGVSALVSTLSVIFSSPVHAQMAEDKTLSPIIVTASRFPSNPTTTPIGATVITSNEIRAAGINNVNEAIRKIGGVYGRQSFFGTQDYVLDMRGFGGDNPSNNIVILVDGVRLSENEQTAAITTSVPIELVDRIEIDRGGSSVLYGDGATGGVINIITKRAPVNGSRGSVVAEAGSFDHRDVRASVAKGWDGFSLDANIGSLRTDNYRENNEVEQDTFSGGLQWAFQDGRIGLRVDALRQKNEFPGGLSLAEFRDDPRQTKTPSESGAIDMDRYTVLAEKRFGSIDLAAELSQRITTTKFKGTFPSEADSKLTQFSPRIRHSSKFATYANELIVGLDFSRWNRERENAFGADESSQNTRAFYIRNEVRLNEFRFAAGARTEKFEKELDSAFSDYDKERSLNAWELEGNYALSKNFDVFSKVGRSYRVANADDNGGRATVSLLKPQTSRDLEVGATLRNAHHALTVRAFQHRIKDEIFYDPTVPTMFGLGANTNLDSTKRKGVEIEGNARFTDDFSLSTVLQHVSAKFTDGPNDGTEIYLVPKNTATLRFNWRPYTGHTADMGVQWVDSQRYGSDFANTCSSRIPSFTTIDARYALRTGPWEFAIAGSNLADKDYYSSAFSCRGAIYPEPGRQIKVSARMDF
jgi:iron complex outermembrane recepter protein